MPCHTNKGLNVFLLNAFGLRMSYSTKLNGREKIQSVWSACLISHLDYKTQTLPVSRRTIKLSQSKRKV